MHDALARLTGRAQRLHLREALARKLERRVDTQRDPEVVLGDRVVLLRLCDEPEVVVGELVARVELDDVVVVMARKRRVAGGLRIERLQHQFGAVGRVGFRRRCTAAQHHRSRDDRHGNRALHCSLPVRCEPTSYRRREQVSYECSNPLWSGVGSPSKSWSISSRTNWTRLCTPSLRYALNTWDSTVRGLMCNAAPISRAVAPEAMCLMTSSSRAVNLVSARSPASCCTATVSMLTTPALRTRLRLLPSSAFPPLLS